MAHAEHGFVEVGGLVDDDGVLAAHLADDVLDAGLVRRRAAPAAARMSRPTALEPVKAIEGDARIADQGGADGLARPGHEVEHVAGHAGLPEDLADARAMPRVCSAGLTMTVLPVTRAAVVMPVQIASGKFQGLMTTATPRGSCQQFVELADEPAQAPRARTGRRPARA